MAKEFEDNIICPYCDYEFSESWEYNECDSEEVECHNCSKKFNLSVNISVTYSTKKIDCDDSEPPEEHEWGEARSSDYDIEWIKKHHRSEKNPYTLWLRDCKKCDYTDVETVEFGGKNPWEHVK